MLSIKDTLLHYKRPEVQKEILLSAKNREIGVMFNKGFGKRPDTLTFPEDILTFVKNGATSFHFSEEIWQDPLQIRTDMTKKETLELRTGWDLVLDVDFEVWEITKIISDLLIKAIKRHNISSVTCKFSGNKGFHIGVPFESFPDKVNIKGKSVEIKELFPEGVQRIAKYLMDYIDNKYNHFELSRMIIKNKFFKEYLIKENKTISEVSVKICSNKNCNSYGKQIPQKHQKKENEFICENCGLNIKKENIKMMQCPKCKILMKKIKNQSIQNICPSCKQTNFINKIDLKIDTILISSRHLFRGNFSMHEKSGLVSIPMNPDKVLEFRKIYAQPKNIIFEKYKFLSRKDIPKGEAERLIVQSFDYNPDIKIEKERELTYEDIKDAVPEDLFPPCIKEGFKGLKDGRKRHLFTIINFLTSVGWSYPQIEDYLVKWNKNNEIPLREVLLKGQVRYHKAQKKKTLPPNCDNKMYYMDVGLCKPDSLCKNIKNPVSYTRIRAKNINANKKKTRKKKTVKKSKDKTVKDVLTKIIKKEIEKTETINH